MSLSATDGFVLRDADRERFDGIVYDELYRRCDLVGFTGSDVTEAIDKAINAIQDRAK